MNTRNAKNHHISATTVIIIALVIGLALIATTITTTQTAYAQLVEIEQEAESENGVHTGSISVKVEPQGEPDDEPAHRGEITHILPNDRILFRIVESAPQSSNAAVDQDIAQAIVDSDDSASSSSGEAG